MLTWDESLPLHLTWDENVNPYLTCLVWQGWGKHVRQIDEICLEDPRNRVSDVCKEFMSRYPIDRVKGLFVYGDRTSIKEDTKLEKGENFFTKILEHLKPYRPALRMQTSNPSIVQSAGFINQIYSGRIEGLDIIIGTNCKKSLHDYQYADSDDRGDYNSIYRIDWDLIHKQGDWKDRTDKTTPKYYPIPFNNDGIEIVKTLIEMTKNDEYNL